MKPDILFKKLKNSQFKDWTNLINEIKKQPNEKIQKIINYKTKKLNVALLSIHKDNFKLFYFLLENKVDLYYFNKEKSHVFDYIVLKKNADDIILKILKQGYDPLKNLPCEGFNLTQFIARSNLKKSLSWLVENKINLNNLVDNDLSMLHYAVKGGHFDTLKFLIEKGADPLNGANLVNFALANNAHPNLISHLLNFKFKIDQNTGDEIIHNAIDSDYVFILINIFNWLKTNNYKFNQNRSSFYTKILLLFKDVEIPHEKVKIIEAHKFLCDHKVSLDEDYSPFHFITKRYCDDNNSYLEILNNYSCHCIDLTNHKNSANDLLDGLNRLNGDYGFVEVTTKLFNYTEKFFNNPVFVNKLNNVIKNIICNEEDEELIKMLNNISDFEVNATIGSKVFPVPFYDIFLDVIIKNRNLSKSLEIYIEKFIYLKNLELV